MTTTASVLPHLHTRQLLEALRMTRAIESRTAKLLDDPLEMRGLDAAEDTSSDDRTIVSGWWLGSNHDDSTVTVAQLKAELSKREHVPNKQESIEQRKAKQQRNRRLGRKNR